MVSIQYADTSLEGREWVARIMGGFIVNLLCALYRLPLRHCIVLHFLRGLCNSKGDIMCRFSLLYFQLPLEHVFMHVQKDITLLTRSRSAALFSPSVWNRPLLPNVHSALVGQLAHAWESTADNDRAASLNYIWRARLAAGHRLCTCGFKDRTTDEAFQEHCFLGERGAPAKHFSRGKNKTHYMSPSNDLKRTHNRP